MIIIIEKIIFSMFLYSPCSPHDQEIKSQAFGHGNSEKDQEHYIKNARIAIDHIVNKIFPIYFSEEHSNQLNTNDWHNSSFNKTIQFCSRWRKDIATTIQKKYHILPEKNGFGIPRKENWPTVYELILGGSYEVYGKALASRLVKTLENEPRFQEVAKPISKTPELTNEIEALKIKEKINSLKLNLCWKFFQKEEIDPRVVDFTDRMRIKTKSSPELIEEERQKCSTSSQVEALKIKQAHILLKMERDQNPIDFEQKRDLSIIKQWINIGVISKDPSHYAIGTLSYSVNDSKPIILTKYSTYFDLDRKDYNRTISDQIINQSYVKLTHQDVTDIDATLQDAKLFFDKALNWKNDEPTEELILNVALMIYLLSHNHRDVRGTAAETEWIERAIYQFHQFDVESPPERMPDLIALTHFDLDEYLQAYQSSFQIKRRLTTLSFGFVSV